MGTIALGAFWVGGRDGCCPPPCAAIAGVVFLAATVLDDAQRPTCAGDVPGALLNVANWRFFFADQSYADLFAAPSPLIHFWSLAIEEQFYLLFPLLMFWLLARRRVSTRTLGVVFAVGFGLAALSAVLIGPGNPRPRLLRHVHPGRRAPRWLPARRAARVGAVHDTAEGRGAQRARHRGPGRLRVDRPCHHPAGLVALPRWPAGLHPRVDGARRARRSFPARFAGACRSARSSGWG